MKRTKKLNKSRNNKAARTRQNSSTKHGSQNAGPDTRWNAGSLSAPLDPVGTNNKHKGSVTKDKTGQKLATKDKGQNNKQSSRTTNEQNKKANVSSPAYNQRPCIPLYGYRKPYSARQSLT